MNSADLNRTCIILNPAAKGDKAQRWRERIRSAFPQAALWETEGPEHGNTLARKAAQEGYDTVIAAGGDGTLNEVVNGLAGSDVQLGILPIGTVNVFAMELGMPMRFEDAVACLKSAKVRRLDLPSANDHYFIQLAGVGLDAQILQATDLSFKKALGPISYFLTATHVAGQKPPELVCHDEKIGEIKGSFVLVGNGRFYGGPFRFFPHADLSDGWLDVCVFENSSYLDILRYLQGILTGQHTRFKDVHYFQSKKLLVTSDQSVPMEADGELIGHIPVEFAIRSQGLKVLTPASRLSNN
jgi:YegS/Rv2252/BmrU family lipid kinase